MLSGTLGAGGVGSFAAFAADPDRVIVYCEEVTGTDSGPWVLARSGAAILGSFTGMTTSFRLTGTVNRTAASLTYSNGSAQGTVDGTFIGGTWGGSTSNCT